MPDPAQPTTPITPAVPATAPAPQGAPEKHSSKASVLAAIASNIAVGIVKFIAAAISGSAAMVSEGIHSIVDSGNGFLVLYGMRQAKKPATIEHPFGFGKELYFWTLVVAVSVFALGGGVSLMQGIHAVQASLAGPVEHGNLLMSYIVLIAAMLIEGASLRVAIKSVNAARGSKGVFEYIKECKDPSNYTVLLEDSAAELGLCFALIGLILTQITGNSVFDGIASVIIGLLLMCVSVVMLRESKGLLVGEGMSRAELIDARAIIESDPVIEKAGGVLTMYFGPSNMLMAVDATFRKDAAGDEVMAAIDRVERALKARFPQAARIYIESENLSSVERQRQIQRAMPEE